MEPKPWILPTPPTNNNTTTSSAAAASSNLQQKYSQIQFNQEKLDFICGYLFTTSSSFGSKRPEHNVYIGFKRFFPPIMMRHKVNSQQMAEGSPEKPKSPTKQLSDTDASDEEQVNPVLKT